MQSREQTLVALRAAMKEGNGNAATLLLSTYQSYPEVDLTVRDQDGKSLLCLAIENDIHVVVDKLMAANKSHDSVMRGFDSDHRSLLFCAANACNYKVLEELIARVGADLVNEVDIYRHQVLDVLCGVMTAANANDENRLRCIAMLINAGGEIESTMSNGKAPVEYLFDEELFSQEDRLTIYHQLNKPQKNKFLNHKMIGLHDSGKMQSSGLIGDIDQLLVDNENLNAFLKYIDLELNRLEAASKVSNGNRALAIAIPIMMASVYALAVLVWVYGVKPFKQRNLEAWHNYLTLKVQGTTAQAELDRLLDIAENSRMALEDYQIVGGILSVVVGLVVLISPLFYSNILWHRERRFSKNDVGSLFDELNNHILPQLQFIEQGNSLPADAKYLRELEAVVVELKNKHTKDEMKLVLQGLKETLVWVRDAVVFVQKPIYYNTQRLFSRSKPRSSIVEVENGLSDGPSEKTALMDYANARIGI